MKGAMHKGNIQMTSAYRRLCGRMPYINMTICTIVCHIMRMN